MDKNINLTPIRKIRNDFQPNEVIYRNCKSINNYILCNNITKSQTFQCIYTDDNKTLQPNEIHYDISSIPSKYKPVKKNLRIVQEQNFEIKPRAKNKEVFDNQSNLVLDENLCIIKEQNFEIKRDIEEIDKILISNYTTNNISTNSNITTKSNIASQIQQLKDECHNNYLVLKKIISEINNNLKRPEKNNIKTKKLLAQYLILDKITKNNQATSKCKIETAKKTTLQKKKISKKTNIIQIEQELDKTLLQYDAPKKHTNIIIEYEKAKDNYLFYGGSYKKYKELEQQYNKWLHSDDIKNNKKPKNTKDINKTKNKKLI